MKKRLTFILLSILITGCALTPQQKAEKLAKEYVKSQMKNPDSYESVSFTKLDSIYQDFEFSKEGETIQDSISSLSQRSDDFRLSFDNHYTKKQIKDSIDFYQKKIDNLSEKYKKEGKIYKKKFVGFGINNTYRGTNGFGGVVTENIWIFLDKDFNINQHLYGQ